MPRFFLTPAERGRRIEAVMRQRGWTWYHLSKLMNRNQTSAKRALCETDNPSLHMLKAAARALNVTVGFLVDYKPTS